MAGYKDHQVAIQWSSLGIVSNYYNFVYHTLNESFYCYEAQDDNHIRKRIATWFMVCGGLREQDPVPEIPNDYFVSSFTVSNPTYLLMFIECVF